MTTRRHLATFLCAGLLGLGPGLAGCGGNGKATKKDPAPTTSNQKEETREPEAPVPENLGESPCGNPKWGQLPDQHDIDGDPKDDDSADGSSDSADDSEDDAEAPTSDGANAN